MGGNSGGGGRSGRSGGGEQPAAIDVSRSGGSMSGNPIEGSFRVGDDVRIDVLGTSYKDRRLHDKLKDAGFTYSRSSESWHMEINKVASRDEIMSPINRIPNRASEIKIKVKPYNYNEGVDRW